MNAMPGKIYPLSGDFLSIVLATALWYRSWMMIIFGK
jgi:hypothetical protein